MKTIYVYQNDLLGDNEDKFDDLSLVDEITCDTDEDCDKEFDEKYDSNDYCYSYTKHAE